jgi:hypothetical protein
MSPRTSTRSSSSGIARRPDQDRKVIRLARPERGERVLLRRRGGSLPAERLRLADRDGPAAEAHLDGGRADEHAPRRHRHPRLRLLGDVRRSGREGRVLLDAHGSCRYSP